MGYFVTPPQGGGEDPFDAAIMELPPEFVAHLEARHRFLTLDQLDPADQFAAQPSAYMIAGFPSSLSTPGPTLFEQNGMVFGGLKYSGAPSLVQNFYPNIHVAIEYSDQGLVDIDGTHASLPDPSGISGGAIWRTVEPGNTGAPRLVGLVQRWERKPPLIIGTQIEYILELICRCYPGTADMVNLCLPLWRRPGWTGPRKLH